MPTPAVIMPSRVAGKERKEVSLTYQDDPVGFIGEVLGCRTLYDKQREIAEGVRDYQSVATVGANSSGKDFLAGRLILWWLSSFSSAKCVVLGPTSRQVTDIVWRECRSAYLSSRYPLGGRMYPEAARWVFDDNRFALGYATDDAYNIQGWHSPNLFVILTEAHNIPQEHIEAVKRLNPKRLLMTANPFSDAGELYDAFHSKSDLYHTIQISAFDTPNVQQGQIVIPGMVTQEDIDRLARDWGEENPLYIASVLGQFPENLESNLISRQAVIEATRHTFLPEGDVTFGVDVARFGNDMTKVYKRQGQVANLIWSVQGRDTQQVAGRVGQLAIEHEAKTIVVDDVGVGGGVTDTLKRQELGDCRIIAFNGGSPARKSKVYANAITEAWLELANLLKGASLGIDNNQALIGQLASRRYEIQGDRRLKLEGKEEYKKRVGRSPDDADALAMACYSLPLKRQAFGGSIKGKRE